MQSSVRFTLGIKLLFLSTMLSMIANQWFMHDDNIIKMVYLSIFFIQAAVLGYYRRSSLIVLCMAITISMFSQVHTIVNSTPFTWVFIIGAFFGMLCDFIHFCITDKSENTLSTSEKINDEETT